VKPELVKGVIGVLIPVLLLGAGAAGCGGGSSASGDSAPSPEASKGFLDSKGKNKIPKFGEEADEEEREAASAVLEESLQAREAGDWQKQCETLTAGRTKSVEENGERESCANAPRSKKSANSSQTT
jgi:hypothetical protein